MVRSIAVVLAAVAVILFITHRASPDPVREVSITNPLTLANISADYPILVPQGQAGYRLTSARWETTKPGVWHLGYVTPESEYVQLEQSATKELGFIADQLTGTTKAGTELVDAVPWTSYAGSGKAVLVHTDKGVTTAVSGTAPMPELVRFANSLIIPAPAP